ncbi:MAG: sulfite exporter TauE/SafE family protein [Burkholderiales bacterium]|jgi:hypothetical protein|nr:sulfite exporter TauE/SafE family protein [Burkholderiales bacterium]
MGSLLATALAIGFLGGIHCVGMCGGIVAALTLRRPGEPPAPRAWRLQLGYNAGRIASYTVAGGIAGLVGSVGTLLDRLLPVQLALYVLANALLVFLGLYLAGLGTAVLRLEAAGGALWRFAQSHGLKLGPAQTPLGAVGAGLAWGWIPCGLVYSAVALALVSGDAARGALVMLAFGLGTLPTLLATGLAADRLKRLARDRRVRVAAGIAVLAMGIVGFIRAPGLLERIKEGILCIT